MQEKSWDSSFQHIGVEQRDQYFAKEEQVMLNYQVVLFKVQLSLTTRFEPLRNLVASVLGPAIRRIQCESESKLKYLDRCSLLLIKLQVTLENMVQVSQQSDKVKMRDFFGRLLRFTQAKFLDFKLKGQNATVRQQLAGQLQEKEDELLKLRKNQEKLNEGMKQTKQRSDELRSAIKEQQKRIQNLQAQLKRRQGNRRVQKQNSEMRVRSKEEEEQLRGFIEKMNMLLSEHEQKVQVKVGRRKY